MISALTPGMVTRTSGSGKNIEIRKASMQDIPPLLETGQSVMFYAYNFAQDKALEQAVDYSRVADGLQKKIQFYRTRRSELAEAAVHA